MNRASALVKTSHSYGIRLVPVLAFLCLSTFSFAQAVYFELITGTNKFDDAKCIIQTLDSGYVVVGSTSAFGNGQSDIYLTKISKSGQVSWQQALGSAGVDKGNAVIQTPDSGFAITGYSNSTGNSGYDVYLVKTDKNGFKEWSNTYGGPDWDFGNSLLRTPTGNYVICGSTYSYGKGNGDVYLLETDSSGVLQWDSAYGGTAEDVANSVSQIDNGGYFVTGVTKSFGQGENDILILKSDVNGNLVWMKTYGGSAEEIGSEGKTTVDGGFVVVGATKSKGAGTYFDYWLLKMDAAGDTLWTRSEPVAFSRIGKSVCQTTDGGFIMGGEGDFNGDRDLYAHKVDPFGYFQGINTFGGSKQENMFSIKQTFDGGYVMVGTTESYGIGTPNIYLVRTRSNLTSSGAPQVVVGVEEQEITIQNFDLFPNPAADYFLLTSEFRANLQITDVTGRTVLTREITKGTNRIHVDQLTDGVYFLRTASDAGIGSGKVIVKH